MEDNKELQEYIKKHDELLGFARTQYIRENEHLSKLHEQCQKAEFCKQPESKENGECSECLRLHGQICRLSSMLHTSEKEMQEMYLEMKQQLDNQFELNHKLVAAMQGAKALEDNEKVLKEKIESKEAELHKLESSRLNSITSAKKTISQDVQKKFGTINPSRELPPKPMQLEKH